MCTIQPLQGGRATIFLRAIFPSEKHEFPHESHRRLYEFSASKIMHTENEYSAYFAFLVQSFLFALSYQKSSVVSFIRCVSTLYSVSHSPALVLPPYSVSTISSCKLAFLYIYSFWFAPAHTQRDGEILIRMWYIFHLVFPQKAVIYIHLSFRGRTAETPPVADI